MDVKLIRAFIASPSGLDEERQMAHNVAQQVNDTVAREMGGRLELIGWEETLSGSGRPQALINADMETCDLFIGAMWTKWGSRPALDGSFSSGFEEEFELSRARFANTGSPLMSMFFKEIDELQLQDPGEDLKKVLAFQETLRQEKEFYYDKFSTPESFADKVREFLTRHTIRLLQGKTSTREDKFFEPSSNSSMIHEEKGDDFATSASTNLTEAKFLVSTAKFLNEAKPQEPSSIARIRLIGAISGGAENDKILLGVHDANLLYQERRNYTFSHQEKRGLLQTALTELEHENVPLWSWLAEMTSGKPDVLALLTMVGEDAQRVGALTVLRLLGESIRFHDFTETQVVEIWLSSDVPGQVRVAALRYLKDYGTDAHLAAIANEVSAADKDTLTPAIEAALAIHLRSSDADAANYVLSTSFESIDDGLLSLALAGFEELGTEGLKRGLDHRSAPVRARTIKILNGRDALGLDTVDRAKEDDALLVRLAALRALERLGQSPSLDEARKVLVRPRRSLGLAFWSVGSDMEGERFFEGYLIERLRTMPLTSVEALLSSTRDRHAAYLALAARRSGDFGRKMRNDLLDNFAEYAALHWPEGMKSAGSVSSLFSTDPLVAKRQELVRQALDIVANQRDETDLQLLRRVLDSKFIRPTVEVIRYIKSLGEPQDIERLSRVARYTGMGLGRVSSAQALDDAARAILKLRKDDLSNLSVQVPTEDICARVIDLAPSTAFERLTDSEILHLMLTDQQLVRRSIAKKVPASLPRRRVRRLLQAYRSDPEGRFYIFSHWLDLGLAYPRAVARRVALAKG